MIVARCKRCGGWTMFHVNATSQTAIEWAAICRKDGDEVAEVSDDTNLGPTCADSWGKEARERQCEVRS